MFPLITAAPIIGFLLCLGFAYYFRNSLLKHNTAWYTGTIILLLILGIGHHFKIWPYVSDLSLFSYSHYLIKRGIIGTSLFFIVMFIGCIPYHSKWRVHFQPIRGILSILASFFVLYHSYIFLVPYIRRFIRNGYLKETQLWTLEITVLALLLMIPLCIMSFRKIREKMNPSHWLRYQRFSYLFYFLIYAHIFLLYHVGIIRSYTHHSKYIYFYTVGLVFYSAIFLIYTFLKIPYQYFNKSK